MQAFDTILDAIGNTPLVKLRRVVGPNDANVYAKCEYLNPSGSVKDRFVLYMLNKALETGELKSGGSIVENTSGNTGAAVAMWAAVHGIHCTFTIPDKMSTEKINTLKAMGADVVVCPTNVPADSPKSYYETAKRLAAESGSYYINQYHNPLNIEGHYHLTGKEIWEQTDGDIDYFVAGLGTGGTMSGAGKYIKEQKSSVQNVGVDPIGSVYYSLFKTGKLSTPHVYKVEGIGEDMECGAMDMSVLDDVRQVDDRQSFIMARRLAREEGLFAGGSSGSTAHVAVELAKEIGPGKNIVVILTDGGKSYISKFYNDEWMLDNGFMVRTDAYGRVSDVLNAKRDNKVYTVGREQSLGEAVAIMRDKSISQMPVCDAKGKAIGMVHEVDLLQSLVMDKINKSDPIEAVMKPLEGVCSPNMRVGELNTLLSHGLVAVVERDDAVVGLITKIDLIDYISQRSASSR